VVTSKPCKHADKQKFQSRIWNPFTRKQDRVRSYETRDVEEAFTFHRSFVDQLKATNYSVTIQREFRKEPAAPRLMFLKEAAKHYLDYLQDIGVPEQEKKQLTRSYINDPARYIMRFLDVVKRMEKKITDFPINAIQTDHVSEFHRFLKKTGYSQRSYNAHMQGINISLAM
jgi:hypothetical protein